MIGRIVLTASRTFRDPLVAFLLFQASILLLYFARVPRWLKVSLGCVALGILMPILGTINGYYLEVATQVGIFVALALGLNIVVGLAGLLDLGYVAFYAVGAYTWAIFGSPQAAKFIPASVAHFPLSGGWFFVFLFCGGQRGGRSRGSSWGFRSSGCAGDYLAIVTLGFGEVIRVLANNLDKPINFTNGPQGITPITRPPLFFQPLPRRRWGSMRRRRFSTRSISTSWSC